MKITLRAARVNAGLTQQEAGKRIGVDRGTIIRWEQEKSSPRNEALEKLCQVYGIHPEDIQWRREKDYEAWKLEWLKTHSTVDEAIQWARKYVGERYAGKLEKLILEMEGASEGHAQ